MTFQIFVEQWRTWLQIAVLALALAYVLRTLASTQGRNAAIGLAAMGGLYAVIKLFSFDLLAGAIEQVMRVGIIILVVLFREEARRLLAQIGKQAREIFRIKSTSKNAESQAKLIDEIAQAIDKIIQQRAGALIAIELEDPLGEFISTGYAIDSAVSAILLETIFTSKSPAHDGAVVIQDRSVVAAGSVLPLSKQQITRKGTRHRAALGLSESTDSMVIVVSEERGEVHVARQGELIPINPNHMRRELLSILTAGVKQSDLEEAGLDTPANDSSRRLSSFLERANPRSLWTRGGRE